MKNPKYRLPAAWLFLLVSGGAVALFAYSFPLWNVPLYLLSLVLLAGSAGGLAFLAADLRGRSRPLLRAGATGVLFLAAAFGVVLLVNNAILHAERASLAAAVVTVLFSVFFIGFFIAVAVKIRGGRGATACLLLVGLIPAAFNLVGAARAFLPETYAHPFVDKIQETRGLDAMSANGGLIINADDSHWWDFFNRLADAGAFDDASMDAYVMQYADSGVSDIMFNIFGQSSDTPTEVLTFRGDLFGQETQNGAPVDYGNYYGLHTLYNVQKKDIFARWFDTCRTVGIRPWISIRMNDCHDPDEETSQLRGELFYTARENGWMIGEEYGYYRNCLNYAVPEVRQLMLDYTREQLMRYDVYGLELDWMREIYCFDYIHADNDEIVGIMNDYMRDTAEIVAAAEQKWGHEIRLAVRLMRDIDQCMAFGFDALTWCEEGLIDAITVTPRFTSNDSGMPIADWKARCKNVEIWAGVETLVNFMGENAQASAEVVRGYAAQYLTAGADKVYLFNYMSSGTVMPRQREVYDTCGDAQTILSLSRRHVVTWQDIAPVGWEPYRPLPLRVRANQTQTLRIETGYIPENAAATLYIGTDVPCADDTISVTLGERDCAFAGASEIYGLSEADMQTPVAGGYCPDGTYIYKYTLPEAATLSNLQQLTLRNNGAAPVNITYAEISVQPE